MTSVITAITAVFTAIMEWITGAIADITPIFYVAESGLTFMGTLAIMGLGISIFFLLVHVVTRFIQFKAN